MEIKPSVIAPASLIRHTLRVPSDDVLDDEPWHRPALPQDLAQARVRSVTVCSGVIGAEGPEGVKSKCLRLLPLGFSRHI